MIFDQVKSYKYKSLYILIIFLISCQTNEVVHVEPIELPKNHEANSVSETLPDIVETHSNQIVDPEDSLSDDEEDLDPETQAKNQQKIQNEMSENNTKSIPAIDKHINITDNEIPMEMNNDVQKWMDFFSKRKPDLFERYMGRGNTYKKLILDILRKQEVPIELYYLAMIESGFSTRAVSRASAVGIWQFIRATGKRYGLQINHYVDERQDPTRSTIAASLYLKDLYNVFNSWYLAMAAYNAGESRIMNAIMSGNSRNFWELANKRKLPRETMNYTPKFIAATTIGNAPEKYGIRAKYSERLPDLVSLTVPSPVRLTDIARAIGISTKELKKYNPHILRGITPPYVKEYKVWIPGNITVNTASVRSRLAAKRISKLARYSSKKYRGKYLIHKVRRGENLSIIAAKYRTTVRKLRSLNRLYKNRIYAGKTLRIKKNSRVASKKSRKSKKTYRVKRGDNLFNISRKFGISIKKLKKINRLRKNRIYVGQLLKLSGRISG